jgi:hypothetical protein
LPRQQNHHRKRIAEVRQFDGLELAVLKVTDIFGMVHERGDHLAGPGNVERLRDGFTLIETFHPTAFEINRVDQNQSGEIIQTPGWEDTLDFVVRLNCHPTVDFTGGGVRSGFEIDLVDVGLVFDFGDA